MISWFERHNIISWIITFLIAVVIFYLSSLSFTNVSGEIKGISIYSIIYHITAFLLLTTSLLISIRMKSKAIVIVGLVLVFVYAVLDELHQFFVPGRYPAFSDVLFDSLGILLGLAAYGMLVINRN